MKRGLVSILILLVILPITSASDVSLWQGQYYTGTTFNTGTYGFGFTVYDSLTGGSVCYSNTTTLTTGSWGEWKTEQAGISSACDNASKDYFLEIKIDNVTQGERRRLTTFDYLRKMDQRYNETALINNKLDIDDQRYNETSWVLIQGYLTSVADNSTRVAYQNITNLPVCLGTDKLTFNGTALRCATDSTGSVTADGTGGWTNNSVEANTSLNVNVGGNISTSNYGFFGLLGSLTSRITRLFVQDIDASNNINAANNITARYFIGDGRYLTGASKEVFYPAETSSNNGYFRVRSVSGSGNFNFGFFVPRDFASLDSILVVGIVAGEGAAGSGKNIDISSNCGGEGEAYNADSGSDTTSTYTIPAVGIIWEMNASGVFSGILAGDHCGLNVNHNSIGGAIDYLGIRLKYRTG